MRDFSVILVADPKAAADVHKMAVEGMNFAMLTGDFNPVHWVRPYAKAFGSDQQAIHKTRLRPRRDP